MWKSAPAARKSANSATSATSCDVHSAGTRRKKSSPATRPLIASAAARIALRGKSRHGDRNCFRIQFHLHGTDGGGAHGEELIGGLNAHGSVAQQDTLLIGVIDCVKADARRQVIV